MRNTYEQRLLNRYDRMAAKTSPQRAAGDLYQLETFRLHDKRTKFESDMQEQVETLNRVVGKLEREV